MSGMGPMRMKHPLRRALLLAALAPLSWLAGCATPPPGPGGALAIDTTTYRATGQDSRVQFLILHYTDEDLPRSARILTQQAVSAHYLLSDETPPRIYRLVDEDRRAWHAGASHWAGASNLNSASIGIEIVNAGGHRRADAPAGDAAIEFAPYPVAQIDALIPLIKDIVARHQIRPDRILGHSDIAPQRKIDPGPLFPWARLAAEGLIPWPDAAKVAAARPGFEAQLPPLPWFRQALAKHGYQLPERADITDPQRLDTATRRVIAAFQMKYRPARSDGQPDAETAAMLQALTGLAVALPEQAARPAGGPGAAPAAKTVP
jgi:N-acetylmuramoyl-L-alanine amidase